MATPKRSSRRSGRQRAPSPYQPCAVRRRPQHVAAERRRVTLPDPIDARLVEGIELFNHQQFFSCHEVLEQLWLKADGRPRDFYKGLIQAAVAFYHWSRGNLAGAVSLYRSSSRHLRKYRPEFLSVDVERFLQRYTELFGWLRRHRTRYEDRLVPPLRWTQPPR